MYVTHTHITKEDWLCIVRMLRADFSLSDIARTIGKHPSALSRHVAEHGGREYYGVREVRRKKRMTKINAMDGTRVPK